jgi:hypothetical protein
LPPFLIQSMVDPDAGATHRFALSGRRRQFLILTRKEPE